MKAYNVRCPFCGTLNKSLYLEETDGWMECIKCEEVMPVNVIKLLMEPPEHDDKHIPLLHIPLHA